MNRLSIFWCMIAMIIIPPLFAQQSVEVFMFNSVDTQNRAISLARQLRCPQCQNQNLMESNSPIAKDLRWEVYMRVNNGDTDTQVIDFMTSRFGDVVLYKPKFEPRTYALWLGPLLFLILFAWFGFKKVKASLVE